MDEEELRVILEKEEAVYENEEEDITGDEEGILCGIKNVKISIPN